MKTGFFILLFLFAFSDAFPQYVTEHRIDSLKRILPSLIDTMRIDCLNELSYDYTLISASDYLTKFSRLIRMVLTNSKQSLIPPEDENAAGTKVILKIRIKNAEQMQTAEI